MHWESIRIYMMRYFRSWGVNRYKTITIKDENLLGTLDFDGNNLLISHQNPNKEDRRNLANYNFHWKYFWIFLKINFPVGNTLENKSATVKWTAGCSFCPIWILKSKTIFFLQSLNHYYEIFWISMPFGGLEALFLNKNLYFGNGRYIRNYSNFGGDAGHLNLPQNWDY